MPFAAPLFLLVVASTSPVVGFDDARIGLEGLARMGTDVKAVIDEQGRAHVFLELMKTRQFGKRHVHHFIVEGGSRTDAGPMGPESHGPPRGLRAAAVDRHGRIHVLTTWGHFLLEDGVWTVEAAPWSGHARLSWDPGWDLAEVELVPTGAELYCVFTATGKSVGARRRVGAAAAGEFGAGGVIPWPYRPDKLAIARREPDGWSLAAVVDIDIKEGVHEAWPSGDRSGRVEVFYRRGSVEGRRLAVVALDPSTDEPVDSPRRLSGRSLDLPPLRPWWEGKDFAVDPSSGRSMLVYVAGRWTHADRLMQVVFEQGEPGPASPLGGRPIAEVILEPGRQGLHLLALEKVAKRQFVVTHRTWRDGEWSEPVELGEGRRLEALAVGDGTCAFAAWRPRLRGLVGRWSCTD